MVHDNLVLRSFQPWYGTSSKYKRNTFVTVERCPGYGSFHDVAELLKTFNRNHIEIISENQTRPPRPETTTAASSCDKRNQVEQKWIHSLVESRQPCRKRFVTALKRITDLLFRKRLQSETPSNSSKSNPLSIFYTRYRGSSLDN